MIWRWTLSTVLALDVWCCVYKKSLTTWLLIMNAPSLLLRSSQLTHGLR